MPCQFISGDLFGDEAPLALAHGCNCAGAMGKGVAVQFRKRFPAMYREYKERCEDGRFALGDVFVWRESPRTIFNLGTQQTWRHKAELAAIESASREMIRVAESLAVERIGLPRIGAGLGGLPWASVRPVFERLGEATAVTLVVYEDFVPGGSTASERFRHGL